MDCILLVELTAARKVKLHLEQLCILDKRFKMFSYHPSSANEIPREICDTIIRNLPANSIDIKKPFVIYPLTKSLPITTRLPCRAHHLQLTDHLVVDYLFPGKPSPSPVSRLLHRLEGTAVDASKVATAVGASFKNYELYADYLLLTAPVIDLLPSSLNEDNRFWETVCQTFQVSHIAQRTRILASDPVRRPRLHYLYPRSSDRWTDFSTQVLQNGVWYKWWPAHTMFSAGNITEKMRVGQLAKSTAGSEEVLVDLYAGIGYFVFPYLIHGGIRRAYACEWNPHSLSGLQEGCQLNNLPYATIPVDSRNCENANGGESGPLIPNDVRVIICPGDNRQWARLLATVGATRVNLGLLPDAHQGIPVAAAALSWLPIGQRGFMHIHENVRQGEEDRWAAGLLQLVERELSSMNSSNNSSNTNNSNLTGKWAVQERGRECVKSYCKSVYHWVLDVECVKMGDN